MMQDVAVHYKLEMFLEPYPPAVLKFSTVLLNFQPRTETDNHWVGVLQPINHTMFWGKNGVYFRPEGWNLSTSVKRLEVTFTEEQEDFL